ncbi:MAG: hypothetical protein GC171_16375 [Terrimonas sp.]|nr:hypothetical protein [Terrimonas sp.]
MNVDLVWAGNSNKGVKSGDESLLVSLFRMHLNDRGDSSGKKQLKRTGWENLKDQLYRSTDALIAQFDNKDDSYLETPFADTGYNFHYLIEVILQHDLYHLGQIGITLKLLNSP